MCAVCECLLQDPVLPPGCTNGKHICCSSCVGGREDDEHATAGLYCKACDEEMDEVRERHSSPPNSMNEWWSIARGRLADLQLSGCPSWRMFSDEPPITRPKCPWSGVVSELDVHALECKFFPCPNSTGSSDGCQAVGLHSDMIHSAAHCIETTRACQETLKKVTLAHEEAMRGAYVVTPFLNKDLERAVVLANRAVTVAEGTVKEKEDQIAALQATASKHQRDFKNQATNIRTKAATIKRQEATIKELTEKLNKVVPQKRLRPESPEGSERRGRSSTLGAQEG
ncbi:hypothetical protein RQP46_010326 [Phenoliferia psychrophenolica]